MTTHDLWNLAENFNDDLAKSILEVEINRGVSPEEVILKSVYNFDLETPEGVDRLLELLPIMDPDIINDVYQEVFPQYPVDTLAPRLARIELRGYLMDYLSGEFENATITEQAGGPTGMVAPPPSAGQADEAAADEQGTEPPADQEPGQ